MNAYFRREGENCTCETCRHFKPEESECHWGWANGESMGPRPWRTVKLNDFCNFWYGKEAQMRVRAALPAKPLPPSSHHKKPPLTWADCVRILRRTCLGVENAKTFAALHQFVRKERRLKVTEFADLLEIGSGYNAVQRDGERYYLDPEDFYSQDLAEGLEKEFNGGPATERELLQIVAERFPGATNIEASYDAAVSEALKKGLVEWDERALNLWLKGKMPRPKPGAETPLEL